MAHFSPQAVIQDEINKWLKLHSQLQSQVRNWVYGAHLVGWRGQEDEITNDIVCETIARVCEREKLAAEGKAAPINSVPQFSRATAHNLFIDLVRKDRRTICFSQLGTTWNDGRTGNGNWEAMEELVADASFHESLFNLLAKEISLLPRRQKLAMLIDLAGRMYFDAIPTLLQQAFLQVGVRLEESKNLRPANPIERRQLASLSSIAYRRLTRLPNVKTYLASV